jgi:hypothetical protein
LPYLSLFISMLLTECGTQEGRPAIHNKLPDKTRS